MIRVLDFLLSFLALLLFLPLLIIILFFGYFSTGSPLFIQKRVGQFEKPFNLIKFRTMKLNTISVSSHLVNPSEITRLGKFLRSTKLDELPQLLNVIKGEMSLVGPRPGLFNQSKLLEERRILNIFKVRPGITGLAQINKIDMSTPKLLANTDSKMINSFNLKFYFKYIILTVLGRGFGDRTRGNKSL